MGFIRKIENFTCSKCGTLVIGNGYTNHCPNCLHSKHVDITPGDRENSCGSLMEPVGIEIEGQERVIIHRCLECGEIKRCKSSPNDNFEVILQLTQKPIP